MGGVFFNLFLGGVDQRRGKNAGGLVDVGDAYSEIFRFKHSGTRQAALPAGYKLVTVFCKTFRYTIR